MDRRRLTGIALVLASAAGFGSGSLFAQPVYGAGVDWLVLLAWRFLFGAGLTWGWLLLSAGRRAGLRGLDRRTTIATIALGVLYIGNSGAYFAGLQTVSPSLAALIVYIYPALVAVLSLRFGRRLEGRRAWLALAIALLGVALSVGGIDQAVAPPLGGLMLVVVSPVIYSIFIVLSARLAGERHDTVGDRAADGASATAASALMMTTTAAIYWIAAVSSGRPVLPGAIPSDAWFGLVGVGVFSTFIAILGFYAGAQRIGAAQAALISTVEPVWTITLAAILFGIGLTLVQLVGGALILGGVLIAQTGPTGLAGGGIGVRLADE
ncbi:MAG TPA: DMT family transporter [Candidatus Limnocylindrales bacterium]|nr:DMT family transporter [Candidatus Limnocylindrales bacterium]